MRMPSISIFWALPRRNWDAMAGAIGAAVAGDWIEAEAPGAAPVRVAELPVLAVYATPHPFC
ncbi:MAG: hypothetical protein ACKOED_07470 [Aestuariivirga sp.]|uniref:hypothetical protein n=1 Tax=Aestuariivirga sp. TaxID=2650926 RepID=UPI0038D211E8